MVTYFYSENTDSIGIRLLVKALPLQGEIVGRNCNLVVARLFLPVNKRCLRYDCEILVAFFVLDFSLAGKRVELLHGRLVECLLACIHHELLAG